MTGRDNNIQWAWTGHTGKLAAAVAVALGAGIFSAAAISEDPSIPAHLVEVAYVPSDTVWVPQTPADREAEPKALGTEVQARNDSTGIPDILRTTVSMRSGDTIGKILQKQGLSGTEAHQFVQAMSSELKPRHLKAGQNLEFVKQSENGILREVSIKTDVASRIVIARDSADAPFQAFTKELPLTHDVSRSAGTIASSLYLAAAKAGVPDSVILNMIQLYSFDVDFQRDIQPNDTFEVMYEQSRNDSGDVVKNGPIVFAQLTLQGQAFPLYRHTPVGESFPDYFDDKGRAARKTLMRTPIDGARISSGFGTRKHPILGYRKAHKGVDFAARRGTPIMAAGDGVIDYSGRNGSYGIYMRIRHNGEFSTAYAHMSGIKKGKNKGTRVRQGEIIGYVGTTGRSTGPHLHYEILKNGRQVNPQKVRLPTGRTLKGDKLESFEVARATIDDKRGKPSRLAQLETE